jgi:predicted permease
MLKLLRWIRYWTERRRIERDLAEEVEFHRTMTQRDLEAQGMPAAEAAHAARRSLGNTTLALEDARAVWIAPWLASISQDLAYAARNLRKQPSFTVTAVGALALAIGLNTSVFTVFNAVALRPWPVADPGRVVTIHSVSHPAHRIAGFSLPAARYLGEHSRTFTGIVAIREESVRLGDEPAGRSTSCHYVSGNYFQALGVPMELGRGFLPDEDRIDAPQAVAVLGYETWRNRFGADPSMVGREIRIDSIPFTVVGVTSGDFTGTGPEPHDLWVPLAAVPLLRPHDPSSTSMLRDPKACCSKLAGRLAPGVSREQARAELEVLNRRFRSESRLESSGILLAGTPFLANPGAKRKLGQMFNLMFTGVTLLLLLTCANIGNLLLARGVARRREIAVRLSLGAGRRRVIRQLLTESLLLASLAGSVGLLLATWLPAAVMRAVVEERLSLRISPDATVIAYALGLSTLACLAFGLAPALHSTRVSLADSLKGRRGRVAARLSLRNALLAMQVAISIVLLVSASLMLRGVEHAHKIDPGFSVDGVTIARIDLPANAYDRARTRTFVSDLLANIGGEFAVVALEPLGNVRSSRGFGLPGEARAEKSALTHEISPRYFEVLHIPLVTGRVFEPADAGRNVIVINESMAKRYWPGQNPLGQTIILTEPQVIIGVVRDAYTTDLDRVEPTFYRPFAGDFVPKLLVRGDVARISSVVSRLDSRALVQTAPLAQNLDRWLSSSRIGAALAGALGVLALALASIGMFGVFAYAVQQRTREIGIRMALGARGPQVVRFVLVSSSRAIAAGVIIGFPGAAAASKLIEGLLFGVGRVDPLAYGAVAALLAIAGLVATALPARRAARVDPMTALRWD